MYPVAGPEVRLVMSDDAGGIGHLLAGVRLAFQGSVIDEDPVSSPVPGRPEDLRKTTHGLIQIEGAGGNHKHMVAHVPEFSLHVGSVA